jgi:hypothetical protein
MVVIVQGEHGGHGRRALEVRHRVFLDQPRYGVDLARAPRVLVAKLSQLMQVLQALQYLIRRHSEVDQASDLVHANLLESLN